MHVSTLLSVWVYFPGCIDQRARSYPPVCLDPPPECMSLPLLLLLVWIRCQIFQPFNIDHTSNFSGAVHVFSFRIGLYLWFCFSWLSASWTKQPPNNIRQLTGDEMGNSDGKKSVHGHSHHFHQDDPKVRWFHWWVWSYSYGIYKTCFTQTLLENGTFLNSFSETNINCRRKYGLDILRTGLYCLYCIDEDIKVQKSDIVDQSPRFGDSDPGE